MTKVEQEQVGALDGRYTARDMAVLEGLEPVRKRPGMFIGSTGPSGLHHLVWEVVDNSVDEAMAGFCDRIDVTLLADGGCRVVDNGRGIPIDINPQYKLSGVEIALTRLHGGGKFGGAGYKVSGGLHGVGVSVVNALSRKLIVEVDLNGERHRMEFLDGGKPTGKLEVVGPSPRNRRGTTVSFWPDPSIFEEVGFRAQTVLERLQMYAFLNAGPRDQLQGRARGRGRPGQLLLQGRDHRFRQAPQRHQGPSVQTSGAFQGGRAGRRGRGRAAVEHRLQRRACTVSPTASRRSRAAPTSRA